MVVESLTIVVVGVALDMLAVMVMWIAEVCAPELERRPGSNIMESNMPVLWTLDRTTADMVVIGTSAWTVDGFGDG